MIHCFLPRLLAPCGWFPGLLFPCGMAILARVDYFFIYRLIASLLPVQFLDIRVFCFDCGMAILARVDYFFT
jgi:hypothetical protein